MRFVCSVPYTSRPVVRSTLLPCCFNLLDGVVEEKVDQDGVDFGLGVLSFDLPADELDAPDAACYI